MDKQPITTDTEIGTFLDMALLNTPETDDDLFSTDMDDIAEPTEADLEEVESFLPIESAFVFRCSRCRKYHDMLKLKSRNGNLICPTKNEEII